MASRARSSRAQGKILAGERWHKGVFHLDEVRNARRAVMLACSHLDGVPAAKIVFVACGPGMDLLLAASKDRRDDPHDDPVFTLIGRGLGFRVCAATLAARDIARSDIPEAVAVVTSGISEIARLQLREG